MKNLIFILITFLTLSLHSCSSENQVEEAVLPTNLSISAAKVGADGSSPNGDGSGIVNFTISATNATSYKVLINNETLELSQNTFSYTFTQAGTNDYDILVAAYNSAGNTSVNYSLTVYVKTELKLIWQDEFDANGAPNSSKWGYNTGTGNNGWGNNESQYYTDRLDNAIVENGVLKIMAKKENYQGSEYTSARLLTAGKFEFTYGRVDVRAKLPAGGGVWPAIWMLGANFGSVGWPACGEIDIMEYVGNNPGNISSALHTTSSSGNTVNHKVTSITNETTEFHIYSAIWTENSITFLLDDVEYYTYNPSVKNDATWPFYNNQFLILNIAMGGNLGGTIDPNFSTSTMEIDYVRVYQ
ncbi:glycoside hydrolase family 16 protein [uncultured Polaribacter sp.]|uniref:glycoside hydrolase family 16 protein n=1 Tax=uncultured Polaribacter sp. TaxID=174711 RepID=UPI00261B6268|nr:glycoside hydrolase family 16 protein [uncultured Polaribacter sp.]